MADNVSGLYSLRMNFKSFAFVNVTVAVLNIFMNLFFVFCMVFPLQGSERLKQPLNILLGLLIESSIAVHACILVFVHSGNVFLTPESSQFLIYQIIEEGMLFTMRTSVTSHLWLNVFYYCQIVPAQHSFFIWLKENIRVFMYCSLLMDRLFFLSGFLCSILNDFEVHYSSESTAYTNSSLTGTQMDALIAKSVTLSEISVIQYWLRFVYFLLCLCVMLASSCATVLYLRRHMKSMKESSRSFSLPRLHRQMRVTVTGIIQVILQIICSSWVICDGPLRLKSSNFDPDRHIYGTVISLYTFCSTMNLCAGQSIFRQQVIHVWQNLVQMITSLKD